MKLLLLDSSEELFSEWIDGKSFKPAWVRKKLREVDQMQVREVIITMDQDILEDIEFAYK